jgi:hypothetical protein
VERDAAIGHWWRGRGRRVSNVLVGRGVLQVVWHHGMLGRGVRVARSSALVVVVVFIVAVLLAHEVLGPLVLMRAAILRDLSAPCSFSAALNRGTGCAYILVPANGLVDVARRKLVQLLVVAEDDDGHIDGAEHRELVRLLEQAAFALQKGAVEGVSGGSRVTRAARSSSIKDNRENDDKKKCVK